MAIEPPAGRTSTSRRALLAGLLGGLAAAFAGTLGRSQPADAATNPVQMGISNSYSGNETGVTNTTTDGSAIAGYANGGGVGLHGFSPSGTAVYGNSSQGMGVYGQNFSGTLAAMVGASFGDNTGVEGYSGSSSPAGVAKTGVYGYADRDASSVGVRGRSPTGRGGLFSGKLAQLRLSPSTATTHPVSGQAGDLFVDNSKRLWFCKGGSSWTRLD